MLNPEVVLESQVKFRALSKSGSQWFVLAMLITIVQFAIAGWCGIFVGSIAFVGESLSVCLFTSWFCIVAGGIRSRQSNKHLEVIKQASREAECITRSDCYDMWMKEIQA